MLKAQVVDEILARLARGASVKRVALEYGVDRKTIRVWRARAGDGPRAPRVRLSILAPHADWLTARAAEVEYNSAVLYRELVERGYTGSAQQVLRFVRPLRVAAARGRAATAGDAALRDGARAASAGRLRAAPRLDRRPAGDRPRVRLHARVFPAHVPAGLSP
jgi:transposase-like protein